MKTTPSVPQIAKLFNVTPEQVRRQFARNAKQLAQMSAQTVRRGGKVNGFTAGQLSEFAEMVLAKSQS